MRRARRGRVEAPCYNSAPVGVWRSLVSALVWGTRGRQFKSGHADHLLAALGSVIIADTAVFVAPPVPLAATILKVSPLQPL